MLVLNRKQTFCKIAGNLHLLLSFFLTLPLPWCFYFEWHPETARFFIVPAVILFMVGIGMKRYGKSAPNAILPRDALLIVAYAWIALVVIGALPYWMSGAIPNFVDALFESISGFTTTGASILTDIESLPTPIQFWRGLTQWIGGLGIVVLFVSVLPNLGITAKGLFKAEATQLRSEDVTLRIRDTTRNTGYTYALLTLSCIGLLWWAGMTPFDAIFHSFATLSTGGFSSKGSSVAAFQSPTIEWILILFMYLGAINFGLYPALVKGQWRKVMKDAELRFYLTVAVCFVGGSALSVWMATDWNFARALRSAAFQVTSILTTTGFATDDYEAFPFGPQAMIFLCMLMGGMAGSTAGGMKQFRILLLFKMIINNIRVSFQPSLVTKLRVGNTVVDSELLFSILAFFCVYLATLAIGFLCLAFRGNDLLTSLTAVMTCAAAAGPGFGTVGPVENFAGLDDFSTFVLGVVMLLGRLEFFPLMALFHPRFWRR